MIKLGLREKFVLAISVIVVFTVVFLTSYLIRESWHQAYQNLIQQSHNLTMSLSFQAASEFDTSRFAQLASEVIDYPFVAGFHVYANSREALFSTQQAPISPGITRTLYPDEFSRESYIITASDTQPDLLYMTMPIFKPLRYFQQGKLEPTRYTKSDIIGYFVTVISIDTLHAQQLSVFKTVGVMTLGVIAIAILIGVLVTGSFIGPIIELVHATRIVSEGNYGYRQKIRSKDEVGLLTASFNHMTGEIEQTTAQLNDYSKQLEDKVQERTKALKAANTDLEAALKKAQESDQLKTEFLANMSHELRTPLNAIIGLSDMALQELDGPLTDDQKHDVQLINQSGHHLLTLISGILDITKIENGTAELDTQPIALDQLLADILSFSDALIRDKAIVIETNITPTPPISGDAIKLKQVFLNLLSNAVKFTNTGSITISTVVSDTDICVQFTDTGIGIRPENQDKIFDRFSQIDGSSKRRAGGTGIGLALAKEFVQLHKGRIWVESDGKTGSSFFVRLPRA